MAWEVDTKRYVRQIAACQDQVAAMVAKYRDSVPIKSFAAAETDLHRIGVSLISFGQNAVIAIDQLIDNTGLLWSQGRMVGVSSLIRFALEYRAALRLGVKILERLDADGDIEAAINSTARLTFSSKVAIGHHWEGPPPNEAYSVMTFMQALSKISPEALADYGLLSEASHPSFLQNTYFIMASRVYDNFQNEDMRAHAQALLDSTIDILERLAVGAAEDADRMLALALPRIVQV